MAIFPLPCCAHGSMRPIPFETNSQTVCVCLFLRVLPPRTMYSPMQDKLLDRQLAWLTSGQSGNSPSPVASPNGSHLNARRLAHSTSQSTNADGFTTAAATGDGDAASLGNSPTRSPPTPSVGESTSLLEVHDGTSSYLSSGVDGFASGNGSATRGHTPATCRQTPLAAQTKHTHGLLASTLNLANDVVSPSSGIL